MDQNTLLSKGVWLHHYEQKRIQPAAVQDQHMKINQQQFSAEQDGEKIQNN